MNCKIFMCCHKTPKFVPDHCTPIQCGSAIDPRIEGVVHDDDGENISAKNREYCELTAHYYAWKNIEADYYGFCHYRRLLCFDNTLKKPYTAIGEPPADTRLFGGEDICQALCQEFEIIAPRSENMGMTAREHYCSSVFHYSADLEMFLKILSDKFGPLSGCADNYLAQNRQYFCNMFIMDKRHFFEYCEILFSILEEFDAKKERHGSFQSDRTDGYLGEIFTGIYISYARLNGAGIMEIPRADIYCGARKRILYTLLPPETKRRFAVKKIIRRLRGK